MLKLIAYLTVVAYHTRKCVILVVGPCATDTQCMDLVSVRGVSPPLLPLRSSVVLLVAILVGAVAAGVTYLVARELAQTIAVGSTAFASATVWLNKIVA
jgi:hypothetical protein